MVLPLHAAGFHVVASDIADYGCPDSTVAGTGGKGRVNGERPSEPAVDKISRESAAERRRDGSQSGEGCGGLG